MCGMRKTIFAFIVLGMTFSLSAADAWNTDFRKAREEGRAKKLPVMMVFSGSDWCLPCITLARNVLQKKSFIAEASRKYVLFNADFPKNSKLGQKLEAQTTSLAGRYRVYSFPTVIVIDADSGRILAKETGFAPGMTARQFLACFDGKLGKAK